jgi:hypothetical protein
MNQETNIQLVEQFKTESELVMSISSMPELQLFMNEAVELFTEYNLRLLSDAQASRFADEFKDWEYSPNIFYGDKHLGWQWKMKLMDVVTTYNFTSYAYMEKIKTMKVFGHRDNVTNTVWLYDFVCEKLNEFMQQEYKAILKSKREQSKEAADRFCRIEAYSFKRKYLLDAIDTIREDLRRQQEVLFSKSQSLFIHNRKALQKFTQHEVPSVKPIYN